MDASVSPSDQDRLTMNAAEPASSRGAVVSEGVLAGVIAASAVAVVLLVVDVLSGQALQTPTKLGGMLLTLMGSSEVTSGDMATPLALYTLFHFVVFMIAGVLAAAAVQVTVKQPTAILLFVILFFAFEVVFTGFVAYLDVESIESITPYQVAIGNVVASIAMVLFFRARHPALRNIGRTLSQEE